MAKTIFITGATSGFGKAAAEIFAENGNNLIITGRRKDRLTVLSKYLISKYNVEVTPLCFDVKKNNEVVAAIKSLPILKIDVLINNAGLASGLNKIQDGLLDDWEKMIDTNIKGLLYVSRAIIPIIIAQKSGHIINIGSTAGKDVYEKGNVTLVNAPGTGVADDKAVYTYMPEIIKYYLDEDPILNNVHTYHCSREKELSYVLANIDKLVVKPVDESGGYGISIGNKLTKAEIEKVKETIKAEPRKYIAQPIMSLSTHPTYIDETESFESRHVDLRTFTLLGKNVDFVLKGGLTRVALKKGNLVVNSSQGGGSKDTWVLKK
jgi:NAD(P)-dependent dehydrogenase (short-subunit alcohol dehydrogenase family)